MAPICADVYDTRHHSYMTRVGDVCGTRRCSHACADLFVPFYAHCASMVRLGRPPLATQRIWQKYGSVSHTDASDAYHNMSYDIAKETCPYQTDLVRLRTFVRLMEAIPVRLLR